MKTVMFSLFAILFSMALQAQNDQYESYMKETLALYDSVKTLDDYQEIANRFDRIASAKSDEWLPLYYAGLTHIYMSFVNGLESEKRDDYLDKALQYVDRSEALVGESSEIVLLRGYVYMAKVSVNPAIRGMMLSAKVSALFGKALEMDPKNPRANLMVGRWKYGSAQFFGSSTDEACAYMQKALVLFKNQKDSFSLEPHWGQYQAEKMSARCLGKY